MSGETRGSFQSGTLGMSPVCNEIVLSAKKSSFQVKGS